jgi:hypothetical protein
MNRNFRKISNFGLPRQFELDTPTIACVVPREKRWRGFSASAVAKAMADETNASQMEAKFTYIRLNIPAPCPPRRVVLVDQGRGFAGMFHPSTSSSLSVRDATAPAMSATGNQKQIGGARRLFNTGTPPPFY